MTRGGETGRRVEVAHSSGRLHQSKRLKYFWLFVCFETNLQ